MGMGEKQDALSRAKSNAPNTLDLHFQMPLVNVEQIEVWPGR